MRRQHKSAGGKFIAYPRSMDNAFPVITRPTKIGAIIAGLSTGKPFDVHLSSGRVVWTWEQRPPVNLGRGRP